jgi:hypothetical protein
MRVWALALTLGLALGTVIPAHAEQSSRNEAVKHFKRGLELADHGEYQPALDEFERAYELSPDFDVLYNIGLVDVELGRPRKAIDAFKRYLAEGGERVPPKDRAEVEARIARLESSFAELTITTDPSGAQVTVDGAELGSTPLAAPVKVAAGTHVVSASRNGAATETRVVKLTEGQKETVSIALPDLPAPSPEVPYHVAAGAAASADTASGAESKPAPRSASAESRTATHDRASFPTGYVLIGAGVVLGGVTIAHYFWNHGRYETYRANDVWLRTDAGLGHADRQVQNNELATSIQHASAVTVGLGITSGALIAAGVTWFIVDPSSAGGHDRASAENVRVELPRVAVTRDLLVVSWGTAW